MALVVVSLTSCGSNDRGDLQRATDTAGPAGAVAPAGFSYVTVRVVGADGSVVERCVLLADREALRSQGLSRVTDPALAGIDGMLFVFDDDTTTGFWMKDTVIPLSLAFADSEGTVISTADMDPCPAGTDPCPTTRSPEPYRLAIEVPQGALGQWGLRPGARIEHPSGVSCAAAPD